MKYQIISPFFPDILNWLKENIDGNSRQMYENEYNRSLIVGDCLPLVRNGKCSSKWRFWYQFIPNLKWKVIVEFDNEEDAVLFKLSWQ